MSARPYAVAFDVLETLADLGALRARFEDVGQPPALMHPWFLRAQRDGMALALSGEFKTFAQIAGPALRTESGHTVTEEQIDHVLGGFRGLCAHPDAAPAMRRLAEAGVRIGCLTVGSAQNTELFLDSAGLARYVDRVVTVERAGVWKPAAAVYHATARELGTSPEQLALVAVHAWDCHGAKRAGCLAGWCARLEGRYGDVFAPPDVTGKDLPEVAQRLLDLPADLT
jgi:2-haloacid dehalogenase